MLIPFEGRQVCFVTDDGYMCCNAVHRKGVLMAKDDEGWFKFPPRKRGKRKTQR